MKDEEKRETIPWEAKDPKPPVIHSASREPGRVSPPGLSYALLRLPPGTGGAPALGWGGGGICLSPDREENKPGMPRAWRSAVQTSSGWDLIKQPRQERTALHFWRGWHFGPLFRCDRDL